MPKDQLELQIVHDGPVDEAGELVLEELNKVIDIPTTLFATPEAYGYYCAPRNQATLHLKGYYVVHMDADNEWLPGHLSGLLQALRTPDGDLGYPHFAYTRREYVEDIPGCGPGTGPSPLVEWDKAAKKRLIQSPQGNFIDTGDFMVSRSVLYWIANQTGCIWNQDQRRFADWEIVCRGFVGCGLRGKAVDQVTHVYHWTGENIQLTRSADGAQTIAIPEYIYQQYLNKGLIKPAGSAL